MSGGKPRKSQRNLKQWVSQHKTPTTQQMETVAENVDDGGPHAAGQPPSGGNEMASLSKDLRDFKSDLQGSIAELKEDLRKDLKEEMAALKHEINSKLTEVGETLQSQGVAIAEAEQRISDVETSGTVTKDVLLRLIREQRKLREKVIDLQSRSRRNNIRIFSVAEDSESTSGTMIKFVENLLTTQLPITVPLQIQRAHRSLAKKPAPGEKPRSIIVNFLQFEVKEAVLQLAWQKKVEVNSKQCFFDHDYPHEVMLKRRSYGEIKKVLKQKDIGFQTPFTKIRIKWSNGTRTYEDAQAAAREMTARGLQVTVPAEAQDDDVEGIIQRAFTWQRVAR